MFPVLWSWPASDSSGWLVAISSMILILNFPNRILSLFDELSSAFIIQNEKGAGKRDEPSSPSRFLYFSFFFFLVLKQYCLSFDFF